MVDTPESKECQAHSRSVPQRGYGRLRTPVLRSRDRSAWFLFHRMWLIQPRRNWGIGPRTGRILLASFVGLISITSCGDPNLAPEVCPTVSAIPKVETYVGGNATIPLCFVDDSDDELHYTAESSNGRVARVRLTGEEQIEITGVSIGTAVITVTATDSEGLFSSWDVEVAIVNRPPESVGTIAAQELERGDVVTLDLSDYFDDRDGDALVYSAAADDSLVAVLVLSGDELEIEGAGAGSTTVRTAANDREGGEAAQEFVVSVSHVPTTVLYEDQFDQPALADEWSLDPNGSVELNNGILSIWSDRNRQGGVRLDYSPIKLWEIEARLRRVESGPTVAVFGLFGDFDPFGFYVLLIRDDRIDFIINEYTTVAGQRVFVTTHLWELPGAAAQVGEYTTVGLRYAPHRGLVVVVGDSEFAFRPNPELRAIPRMVADMVILSWNSNDNASSASKIEVDWVKVHGAPASATEPATHLEVNDWMFGLGRGRTQ